MGKKLIALFVLAAIAAAVWLMSRQFEPDYLDKLFSTAVWLSSLYLIFPVLGGELVSRHWIGIEHRYRFRRTVDFVFYIVLVLVAVRIWVKDPQALLVSYGLVGAGVAIALQDLFKNFAGGLLAIVNNTYRVGDRIEIDGLVGDVVDMKLMQTTIMELRGWIEGNQPTGRLANIPNGVLLSKPVLNFTKDHDFLWDEISVPITYDSDWRKAIELFRQVIHELTAETGAKASERIRQLAGKYYYIERHTEPVVNMSLTDNWIMIQIRYISPARGRRGLRTDIGQALLTVIEDEPDIRIASATQAIVEFPELKITDERSGSVKK